MWLKASAVVLMLRKIFWVVTRRRFLVYDQRFGITCLSDLQGLEEKDPEDATFLLLNTVEPC
jgi:hypothetical protein